MTQSEVLMKCLLDNWNSNISRVDNLFDILTDEQLNQEVSPGRNRGIYILGHLAAVHSRMLPLLGVGEHIYPQLDEPFLAKPDKAVETLPSAQELRQYWKDVNGKLAAQFAAMTPDDWFQKHTSVSEEDFAKEPHRNRLNVLISRTNHLSYHFGQLIFLKK